MVLISKIKKLKFRIKKDNHKKISQLKNQTLIISLLEQLLGQLFDQLIGFLIIPLYKM